MAKKITPEQLPAEIDQILADYQAGVIKGVNNAVKKLANKGRNAVRRNARAAFSGRKGTRRKYSNGWMYKMGVGSNRWAASAVIYEGRQPGLAHLLEHGHAKVGGGRTLGRAHIKPVDDQLANEAIRTVKGEL